MKTKNGFTLVELLFVMAIVSIMAGVAIAQMNGSTDKAHELDLINEARLINTQLLEQLSQNSSHRFTTSISTPLTPGPIINTKLRELPISSTGLTLRTPYDIAYVISPLGGNCYKIRVFSKYFYELEYKWDTYVDTGNCLLNNETVLVRP